MRYLNNIYKQYELKDLCWDIMMVLRSSFLWTTIDTPALFLFRGAGGGRILIWEMFCGNTTICLDTKGVSRIFANKLFVIYKFVKFRWAV